MTTWKQDHAQELTERQAHIAQKLRQLELIQATLRDIKEKIPQMRAWLESLHRNPDGSLRDSVDYFNPEVFIRMGSIAVFIRASLAGLMGASQGTPTSGSGGTGDASADQMRFAGQAAQIFDAAGDLGHIGLGNFVDQFGVTNKLEQDGVGWTIASEIWALISSPFETYQRHKFTHMALDAYEDLLENHSDDLIGLGGSLSDGLTALDRISRSLDWGIEDLGGTSTRQGAVDQLKEALRLMEEAYDNAGGSGPTAAELRRMAEVPPEFSDVQVSGAENTQWTGPGFQAPTGTSPCSSWDPPVGFESETPCPYSTDDAFGVTQTP